MQSRENWGSRFGFVMAAAGSAVGLGNIWKFPYVTGENGGGAFLLLYLAFILIFGLSLVIAEMAIGRMTQKNPVGAFKALAGGAWPLVGYLGVATGFIILSFYIVVAGWTIAYLMFTLDGHLATTDSKEIAAVFTNYIGDGFWTVVTAFLFMLSCCAVVIGGIGQGIERASRLLMPALFVMLLILVARAVTLDGAEEGLAFYLKPDFSKVTGATFTAAIGQAFFSLSLGMGALITYGSYLSRSERLPGAAFMVIGLDTLVALLAGLMILPAVFAYSLDPSAGPGLTFITLPVVFAQMPGGAIFGFVFFTLLFVAALTSAVSLLEVVVSYLVDEKKLTRTRAVVISALICLALSIPSALSQGAVESLVFGGQSFLDWAAQLTDLLLPLGGLFTALFVGWVLGPRAVAEITNQGEVPFPLAGVWLFICRIVAPLGIAWVLIAGLI